MIRKILLLLILVGGIAAVETVQARHQVELESAYLGEGWFRYTVRSINDPFFLNFDLPFFTVSFGSFEELGTVPQGWTASLSTNAAGVDPAWNYSGQAPHQLRPYEQTFFARSSHRSFKRAFNAWVGMSFSALGGYHGPVTTANVVGYAKIYALVPCSPDEADGSPTNLLERLTIINLPDIEMGNLVRSGGAIVGFSFTYPEESTVLLQGSADFRAWTNIGYMYGNAGRTTFESSEVLNPYGNYFRVLLAAEGHVPLQTNNAGSVNVMKSAEAKERSLALENNLPLRLISFGANELTFSWPAAGTNCVLESASSVSSMNWQPVTASSVRISNNWVLTNHINPTNQFFRLRRN